MTPRSDPHTEATSEVRPTQRELRLEDSLDRAERERDAALAALAALESERDEAIRERDLAIAHDSQPYPTADAYERVCEARDNWHASAVNDRARAVAAEARVTQLKEAVEAARLFAFSITDDEAASIGLLQSVRRLRPALGVVADGGGGRDGE